MLVRNRMLVRKRIRNRMLVQQLRNRSQQEQLRNRKLVQRHKVHRSMSCAWRKSSSANRRTWGVGCSMGRQLRNRKPEQRFHNRKLVQRRKERRMRCFRRSDS
jgi:hypothetical protein